MNELTIANYVVIEPIKGIAVPNTFETYSGKDPGIGRYLVTDPTTQFDDNSAGTNVLLTISTEIEGKSKYEGIHQHSMLVTPAGAMPVSFSNVDNSTDFYELICYDKRQELLNVIISEQFNVQRSTPTGLEFVDATTNSGTEWEWTDVISSINTLMPGSSTFQNLGTLPSVYKPRNLSFNCVTLGEAIQQIASLLHMVVGYDNAETISLFNPGQISSTNASLFEIYDDAIINVRDNIQLLRNTVNLPKNITVCFPNIYDLDVTQNEKINNPFYSKVIEVNATGANQTRPHHEGHYLAERDSTGTATNSAELDLIAAELAARAYDFMTGQDDQKFIYPLAISFVLDGYVRGIRFGSETTTIHINNDKSSNVLRQMERNIEAITNTTVSVFSGVVSGAANGKMIVPASSNDSNSRFFAKLGGFTSADGPPQNRWLYSFTELAPSGKTAGYGGWAAKSGGRSGTHVAFNFAEDGNLGNASVLPEMNGVVPAFLTTPDFSFAIQNATEDLIVVMYEIITSTGSKEYWFSADLGVDGFCI